MMIPIPTEFGFVDIGLFGDVYLAGFVLSFLILILQDIDKTEISSMVTLSLFWPLLLILLLVIAIDRIIKYSQLEEDSTELEDKVERLEKQIASLKRKQPKSPEASKRRRV
jgi:uncharacterized integral membrane protein